LWALGAMAKYVKTCLYWLNMHLKMLMLGFFIGLIMPKDSPDRHELWPY
jgi:hypothetical protein